MVEVDPDEKNGCIVEFRCRQPETLRSEEFRGFAKELCAQIMDKGAKFVARTEVPWELVRSEERAHRVEAEKTYATSEHVDDYIHDKMAAWYQEVCLLEQPFAKDPKRVVGQVLEALQARLGDSLELRRFSHYAVENGSARQATGG